MNNNARKKGGGSSLSLKTIFTGNILFFYAYDIGDDIDLRAIDKKSLVPVYPVSQSAYFKNYHIPLSFRIDKDSEKYYDCISSKIHHFGVFSFCYKIPFKESFEDLKEKVINIKKYYDDRAEKDVKLTFNKVLPAIKKARLYNLKNFYFAVQIDPIGEIIDAQELKDFYGSKIASLLRLETQNLSDYQEKEILDSTTGYYGQDFIIIDSEASFIYDAEFFELMEFFELANIQLLELQYFDKFLDEKLDFFYQQTYTVPLKAYIPILGQRMEHPASRLANLRVDISVVTQRLESSIKMVGEAYYSNLYSMLTEKLSLKSWRESINGKLEIMKDLYTVYQDRLDIIHEEILTLVIIILIAFEVFFAFFH